MCVLLVYVTSRGLPARVGHSFLFVRVNPLCQVWFWSDLWFNSVHQDSSEPGFCSPAGELWCGSNILKNNNKRGGRSSPPRLSYPVQEAVQLHGPLDVLPAALDPLGEVLELSPEGVDLQLVHVKVGRGHVVPALQAAQKLLPSLTLVLQRNRSHSSRFSHQHRSSSTMLMSGSDQCDQGPAAPVS